MSLPNVLGSMKGSICGLLTIPLPWILGMLFLVNAFGFCIVLSKVYFVRGINRFALFIAMWIGLG